MDSSGNNQGEGDLEFVDTDDFDDGAFGGTSYGYHQFEGTTQSQAPDFGLSSQGLLTQPNKNDLTQSEMQSQFQPVEEDDESSSDGEEKSQSQVNDEDSISQGLEDLRFEDDEDEGTVFKVW